MKADKIVKFMELAGQKVAEDFHCGNLAERKLGAQLLLSEVLEYLIHGLGVSPQIEGVTITDPDNINYVEASNEPDKLAMLDGLADVAYTMYWNSVAFGIPLEEGFELVCDNNLDKFVRLLDWSGEERSLVASEWQCGQGVTWPSEVVAVSVVKVGGEYYAVGKDARGKVRKPSTYESVDLSELVQN